MTDMTPSERAAWMAGRDAAAACVSDARNGDADDDLRSILYTIRALTPPDAAPWQPPPE
jgi:hypothetical protein